MWVVAGFPAVDRGFFAFERDLAQEARNAICWLGAFLDPVSSFLAVDLNAAFAVFWQTRVIGPDLFDETAVAWHTAVSDNNAVERAFFRPAAGESNFEGHGLLLSVRRLGVRGRTP